MQISIYIPSPPRLQNYQLLTQKSILIAYVPQDVILKSEATDLIHFAHYAWN